MPIPVTLCSRALILVSCLCLFSGGSQAREPQPKIDAIGVRLFYATSGTLSDDISPPSTFSAHNTIIGEGDAREPANDLLVTVKLSIAEKQGNSSVPLLMKVTDSKGKVLGSRTVKTLFFNEGRTVQALFLQDMTCAGKVTVQASLGKASKSETVTLGCGE